MKARLTAILLLAPVIAASKSPIREARESVYFSSKAVKLTSGSELFMPGGLSRTKTYLGDVKVGISIDPAVRPKRYANFSGGNIGAQFEGSANSADVSANIRLMDRGGPPQYGDFFYIELKPRAWSPQHRPRRIPVVLVESQETSFVAVSTTTATVALGELLHIPNAVHRETPFDTTVTLYYQTFNGTALAGVDYTPEAGIVEMLPGQTFADLATDISILGQESVGKTFSIYVSSMDSVAAVFPPGANVPIFVTIGAEN